MMEDVRPTDRYSRSFFVIEVDWMPTAIFETKWYAEAERVCQNWSSDRRERIWVKGPRGVEYPPFIKLRLAHRDEIGAYAADDAECETFEGTRIVYLRKLSAPAD
jgi:hypothetical protein